MPRLTSSSLVRCLLFVTVLALCTASVARADLKLVAKQTTNGNTTSSTTYYKGSKIRIESGKRGAIIMDGKTQKMYSLNMENKTYQLINFQEMANNPMMKMMDVKTDVALKPGGKTKTIVGKPTKNYLYTASIKMSFNKEMMANMAKQNGGQVPQNLPQLPSFKITGEMWVTEKVNLPPGSVAAAMTSLSAVPGMKPLMEKFRAIKGVALETTQTVEILGGQSSGQNQKTATVTEAISETALPDSLFTVPADFRKVQPMQPGMMGAGGRPGGRPAPKN